MKSIITLFLCFFFGVLQAQDWSFFPKDSLRCYAPNDDYSLSGLSYRAHTTGSGKTTIKLDSFSHYNFVREGRFGVEYYYITGNSILGNRIVIDSDETKLIFLNDSDKTVFQDTFLLLNTNELGTEWQVYSTDSIEINAKIIGVELQETPIGLDSVKEIRFTIVRDTILDSLTMNCAKHFGVIQLLNFSNLRVPNYDLSKIYNPSLMPYKVMTEKKFYEILPGTEFHDVPWHESEYPYSYYSKHKFKYYLNDDKEVVFDKITYQKKVKFDTTPFEETVSYVDSLSLPYRQYKESQKKANPIPSIYNKYDGYLDYQVFWSCNKSLYEISLSKNKGFTYRIEGDTLRGSSYYYEEVGVYDFHFVQGVGPTLFTSYTTRNRSDEPDVKVEYYKTPFCSFGEKVPELNSVKSLAKKELLLFPNPASNTVRFSAQHIQGYGISIYNLNGQTFDCKIENNVLDVSHLDEGFYFIHLYQNGIHYHSKLMVQH